MTDLLRIGHGFDVHRFEAGDHIMLGGVRIPHHQGLQAHSDGDVVLHALCDALLGAAALGDIGRHYPDSSPKFANIDSRYLLRDVIKQLSMQQWVLHNADMTVVAQAPKLAPHIDIMRMCIAEDCNVGIDAVNVKATTTEQLGYVGREEGIAVHAVVTIQSC